MQFKISIILIVFNLLDSQPMKNRWNGNRESMKILKDNIKKFMEWMDNFQSLCISKEILECILVQGEYQLVIHLTKAYIQRFPEVDKIDLENIVKKKRHQKSPLHSDGYIMISHQPSVRHSRENSQNIMKIFASQRQTSNKKASQPHSDMKTSSQTQKASWKPGGGSLKPKAQFSHRKTVSNLSNLGYLKNKEHSRVNSNLIFQSSNNLKPQKPAHRKTLSSGVAEAAFLSPKTAHSRHRPRPSLEEDLIQDLMEAKSLSNMIDQNIQNIQTIENQALQANR